MFYKIAGHTIEIDFDPDKLSQLLPNFTPFAINEKGREQLLMIMHVDQSLKRIPASQCQLIREVDTCNGMTRVERVLGTGLHDPDYQFLLHDINGNECALLQADSRFTECKVAVRGNLAQARFALNNSLMMAYAFSATYYDTLLIHASVVRHQNQAPRNENPEPRNVEPGLAYAFTAKSGTGKSTQVSNWLNNIPDCDLINDDNPVIRIVDGKPILYGSPWSGKTPCYRNIAVSLGAIMLIVRDDHNFVAPLDPLNAFATILTACSTMRWDKPLYSHLTDTIIKFVESGIKLAALHCLPDADSALVCRKYLEE